MYQESQAALPLIVQGDRTLLLDVHAPLADEARHAISPFAELEKSPEHIHTYRISDLSLWNAAAAGMTPAEVVEALKRFSRYPVAPHVGGNLAQTMERYGLLKLVPGADDSHLVLICPDRRVHAELGGNKKLKDLILPLRPEDKPAAERSKHPSAYAYSVPLLQRGNLKQALIRIGWPVHDEVPLKAGAPCPLTLKTSTNFGLRNYQAQAVDSFLGDLRPGMGYGTVVLPCGAGKTVVGIAAMARLGVQTLVLTTNIVAVHQWIREILDKTDLDPSQVGEYSGESKNICPVTVATYQILIWRADKESDFAHFDLVRKHDWGLIVYDEVHLLPAPVFRVCAEVQARRRLGLTATLVREDGLEADVFSLVGPKRYDAPWKDMEAQGWIARAVCHELRIELPAELEIPYASASDRERFRIAAENPEKEKAIAALITHHPDEGILVIGQYIEQLESVARALNAPIITGKTPTKDRDRLYEEFRSGRLRLLVVSKVANFAIDLPDASVAIQISGTFGSRQEEAQRLGRILRPKKRQASFYSIVSRHTVEEEFAANRQQFLTEQGYHYEITIWPELPPFDLARDLELETETVR